MSTALKTPRENTYRMIYIAAGGVVVFAFFSMLLVGFAASLGILLGGLVWTVANFYMANRLFAKAKPATQIVKTLYSAEVMKLLGSAVLLILISKFFAVSIMALLIGYLIAQVAFWISPWIDRGGDKS